MIFSVLVIISWAMASPAFWVAHLEIILVFYAGLGEVIHDLHPLAVVGAEATAEAVVIGKQTH